MYLRLCRGRTSAPPSWSICASWSCTRDFAVSNVLRRVIDAPPLSLAHPVHLRVRAFACYRIEQPVSYMMSGSSAYIYQPLPPSSILLVNILPGSPGTELRCEITLEHLSNASVNKSRLFLNSDLCSLRSSPIPGAKMNSHTISTVAAARSPSPRPSPTHYTSSGSRTQSAYSGLMRCASTRTTKRRKNTKYLS